MKKFIVLAGLIVITIFVALFAWSPWVTKIYAEKRVIEVFEDKQSDIIDGCGFNCEGCGVIDSHKALFGYSVYVEYGCGMKRYPFYAKKFVSFIGTVHNLKSENNYV